MKDECLYVYSFLIFIVGLYHLQRELLIEFLLLFLLFSKRCSNLTSIYFSYFKAQESLGSFL